MVMEPLRKFLRRVIDRLFYHERIDFQAEQQTYIRNLAQAKEKVDIVVCCVIV